MKKMFALSVFLFGSLFSTMAFSQLKYVEGVDYTVLENPLTPQKEGRKEVIEFFSYACPHCYHLEDGIQNWAKNSKPKNVDFHQIPAVGGTMWTFLARVKYVANKINADENFDIAFFDAIHKEGKRKFLGSKKDVINFMAEKTGTDKVVIEKAWNSLEVKKGLIDSAKLWQQAGLTGVPSVIVNGKYLVTGAEYGKFFDVINFLLETTDVE